MSKSKDGSNGADQTSANGGQDDQNKNSQGNDTVSYETYSKVLNKLKTLEAKFGEVTSQLETLESEKREKEGNWKAQAESLQKQLTASKDREKSLIRTFGETNLRNALKIQLAAEHCVDPDLAIKAVDLSDVEFEDDFNVSADYVKSKVSELVKNKTILFKKDVVENHDVNPGNNNQPSSLDKMSTEELYKLLPTAKA